MRLPPAEWSRDKDHEGSIRRPAARVRYGWPVSIPGNLRVTNLFDEAYWSYVRIGDGMLLGTPRTVAGFMKVAF